MPGPAVVPSECQQPMEAEMADDALALETKMSEIADQIQELLKKRKELGPSDMDKDNRIQDAISRLHERRDQLKKALRGQSPEPL